MSEQLQEFEKHPALARTVEWMANNVQMPGTKWNELLREINTALSKPEQQDPRLFVAENEKEMKRLYDWIMDENRRKAGSFFTAGWTRNVAKEIEFRIQKVSREEIAQICEMADSDYAGQEAVMFAEWYESIRYSNYKINPEYFDFDGEGSGLKVKLKPFADLYCIFKEIPSRPSIDIVKQLREAIPYERNAGFGELRYNVWRQCCDKLSELLNQSK